MSTSRSQVRKESLLKDLDRVTPLLAQDRCHSRYKEAFDDRFIQVFSKVRSFLPEIEVEKRALWGIQIQSKIFTFSSALRFDQRHRAVIMSVPLSSLDRGGNLSPMDHDGWTLWKALNNTYAMMCHIMQVAIPADVPQTVTQQQLQAANDAAKARDGNEKDLCRERDMHRCVVTAATDPHVCHIVPWSLNKSLRNIMSMRQFSAGISSMLGVRDGGSYESILAPPIQAGDPRGQSDKTWNMICLSPQLHSWWEKAYFAFEPGLPQKLVGVQKARVDLQFHWMPKVISNATTSYKSIAEQVEESLKSDPTLSVKPHTCHGSPIVQAFLRSGERLATGHWFSIDMDIDEAEHFYNMMRLQWVSINIVALVGGAGCPDLCSFDDDDFMPPGLDVRDPDFEDEELVNALEPVNEWIWTYDDPKPDNESILTDDDPELADSSVLNDERVGELTNMIDTLSLS
ncbi:uncharacterized protein FSUBG_4119 [Fusarium subglutinans]|uniref:HNH nuclease domain-containing protein n=1 Tax=Gibberella subglutinans TaxID=42677 RepID=A0A8H5Q557_GIBSU|nr:uncharacterized protein FSUBG_4119 [Fusarium subglutinans]KAF5609326.1 hypothetical protein FSUBG_4119 [Fusarium subglutinans]